MDTKSSSLFLCGDFSWSVNTWTRTKLSNRMMILFPPHAFMPYLYLSTSIRLRRHTDHPPFSMRREDVFFMPPDGRKQQCDPAALIDRVVCSAPQALQTSSRRSDLCSLVLTISAGSFLLNRIQDHWVKAKCGSRDPPSIVGQRRTATSCHSWALDKPAGYEERNIDDSSDTGGW